MASAKLKLSAVKKENCAETLLACRICLASDLSNVKLFNIIEWGLDQMFVELMGTTMSAWDGLPQYLCGWCRAVLMRAAGLRARCLRAEDLLKEALIHQHFITTSYIRSIDRKLCNLAHSFSLDYTNGDVKIIKHEEVQTDTQTDPSDYVYLVENDFEDVKDFNDNSDDNDDFVTSLESVQNDIENIKDVDIDNIATPLNVPEVNTVESNNGNIGKDVNCPQNNTVESKIVKDVKGTKRKRAQKEKEVKPLVKKKKRQVFNEEYGFKEFEEKYKFKIISLSEKEMVKEMEERKESNNYKRSLFKCEMCYKGFLSQSTYDNHMKTHGPSRGSHECHLCHARYLFPSKLAEHVQGHRLKYQCCVCDIILKSNESAIWHADFHVGTTFKCEFCDQQFLKVTSRNTHVRMVHPREISRGGACTICGEMFASAAGLKTHRTRSHGAEVALPALRCRACKLRFCSRTAVETHRQRQPGGKCDAKHSSCVRCGEVYASEQELLTHRVQQHGLQLFTCDTCEQSFESKESISTHISRVHRLERPPARAATRYPTRKARGGPAVCEHCGKRFPCMAVLKIHMNKHTGETPYKCTQCPKAYTSPHSLNVHRETHAEAPKWRCPDCPAAFLHQSSLYQHRRAQIHSGQKAYQCHICSKTFTQSGSLQTHIKYVHMKLTPPPRVRNKKHT